MWRLFHAPEWNNVDWIASVFGIGLVVQALRYFLRGFKSARCDQPGLDIFKLFPILNRNSKIDIYGRSSGFNAVDMLQQDVSRHCTAKKIAQPKPSYERVYLTHYRDG